MANNKSKFPTFLGIGVPKAGTTWVCDLLGSHPDVLMASRKEVHYFDNNFDKGPDWYGRFFNGDPGDRTVAGEFTTHYLFDPLVPGRVRTIPSIDRMLLMVRNPVERAVSHYRFRCQVDNFTGTFAEFLTAYPQAVDWGRYASHLQPWLDEFAREQILILVYEDAAADPAGTRMQLATSLGIDPARFPAGAGTGRSNATIVPRHRRAYALATRQAQLLRRLDLDWVLGLGRKAGVKRLLARGSDKAAPQPALADLVRLREIYAPEIERLEVIAGLDLTAWKTTENV